MRKVFFSIAITIYSCAAYAQTTHLGAETFSYNGNTVYHYGMGWNADPDAAAYGPMAYLSAYGGIKFFTSGSPKGVMDVWGRFGVGTISPHSFLHVHTNSNQAYNSDFGALSVTPTSDVNKSLSFGYDTSLGTNGSGWIQSIKSGAGYTPLLLNPNNGNVGIGTINPDQKLSVNGTIHSQRVLVDLNGWADYVLRPGYQLPKLSEVKAFIDRNQHLPDVPSEKDLEQSGIDVTEMLKLQMKKIEELTLYLINKDEEEKRLRTQIDELQQQMRKLAAMLRHLPINKSFKESALYTRND